MDIKGHSLSVSHHKRGGNKGAENINNEGKRQGGATSRHLKVSLHAVVEMVGTRAKGPRGGKAGGRGYTLFSTSISVKNDKQGRKAKGKTSTRKKKERTKTAHVKKVRG